MKLIVFGASGPTGLRVTEQALAAGHDVSAVTRHPESFPLQAASLRVIGADLADAAALREAVPCHDAVISAFGVPYSREAITVYSEGMGNLVRAMGESDLERLVCVTSKEVEPEQAPGEPFVYAKLVDPVLRRIGRTLYADMRRMEAIVRASDLRWTIVRPSALFAAEAVSAYRVSTGHEAGVLTSHADLADVLIRAAVEGRHVHEVIEVTTTDGPSFLRVAFSQATGLGA